MKGSSIQSRVDSVRVGPSAQRQQHLTDEDINDQLRFSFGRLIIQRLGKTFGISKDNFKFNF